jgi:lipopolysaccharide export system protein LptC
MGAVMTRRWVVMVALMAAAAAAGWYVGRQGWKAGTGSGPTTPEPTWQPGGLRAGG